MPMHDGLGKLVVPLPQDIHPARKGAVTLLSGEPLPYELSKDGFLTITLPTGSLEEIDTVIRIRR